MASSIFVSPGGGSGGALPTDPVFNSVTIYNPSLSADMKIWKLYIDSGSNFLIRRLNDVGQLQGQQMYVDPWSGGIVSPTGGLDVSSGIAQTRSYAFSQYPFAQLGPAATGVGNLAACTDSTTNTPGATVAGGGSFNVLCRWNGTVWKVIQ